MPQVFTLAEIEHILDSSKVDKLTPPEEIASEAYRRLLAMHGHPEEAVNLLLAAHSLGARIGFMYEVATTYRRLRRNAIESEIEKPGFVLARY